MSAVRRSSGPGLLLRGPAAGEPEPVRGKHRRTSERESSNLDNNPPGLLGLAVAASLTTRGWDKLRNGRDCTLA